MTISADLLTINGSAVPGLKGYVVEYNKLWKDSERNMDGTLSASLIGIFTKIQLTFRPGLSDTQIESILSIFNPSYFNATYYDPATKAVKTEQFYASDISAPLLTRSIYNEFSVDIIATAKRP